MPFLTLQSPSGGVFFFLFFFLQIELWTLYEDLQKKLERLERELELKNAELVREVERANREAERADREAAKNRKTNLVQYLYNVQTIVFPVLVVKDNPTKVANGETNVENKVYPRALYRWTEFPMLHATKFHLLVQAIGNLETLPSLSEVRFARRTLSPTPRRDEQDIRAFIRAHAEAPAADIVSIDLEKHPDPRTTGFEFRNNAYGLAANLPLITRGEDQPPAAKRQSPDKSTTLAPNRWGIRTNPNDTQAIALIGEYKAAHKARAGLLYVYVSSGECMIFLNVKGTHHGDLYFHFVPCSVDLEGQQPAAELVRSTPAAQLTTLSLLALETETQSPGWIDKALGDLSRWPPTKTTKSQSQGIGTPSGFPPPPPPPPADDDDEQGGSSRMPKTPQRQSLTKRTREESPRRGSGSQPAPLDGGSQPGSQRQIFTRLSLSALLYSQLCSLFRPQLAKDLDIGCECLDRYGMIGRVGVLFKITVPEYGYTLVAKGVQAGCADVLAKEAHIYSHCRNLQGIKIPVHLGNIDLARSYPTQSLAFIKNMMLMSWAGITLDDAHVPDGIDINDEIGDTVGALYCAGRPHELDLDEEREGKVPRLGLSLA
ncbi:hypothetical protein B0H67DRAFT_636549 [Lasiosphaeris hirsuta]|uniref:Uncharacterized protein n=1 Tax=Lasiosphaeris hirsuta TaxID=260670 RepID=A0AA40A232_9PEZI|nr:hypothetical protein B0H67DRAFT_636549 [Lasiosphaeris hirsuta]